MHLCDSLRLLAIPEALTTTLAAFCLPFAPPPPPPHGPTAGLHDFWKLAAAVLAAAAGASGDQAAASSLPALCSDAASGGSVALGSMASPPVALPLQAGAAGGAGMLPLVHWSGVKTALRHTANRLELAGAGDGGGAGTGASTGAVRAAGPAGLRREDALREAAAVHMQAGDAERACELLVQVGAGGYEGPGCRLEGC